MLVLAIGAALAAEPEQPADVPSEGTIILPDADPLPSALEDATPIDMPDGGKLEDVLALWGDQRREVWGARNIVRPLVSVRLGPAGGRPLQLGAAVGRQWWQLREGAKATIEAVLSGEAALASGRGSYHADLTVLAGTNAGLLGVQVGPSLVLDRTILGPDDLGRVLALAPVATFTLDLHYVQLAASAAPRFFVAGSRAGAGLGLGDEPVLRGGLGISPGAIRISGDWTSRWTSAGRIDRVGLGFRFRL